MCYFEDERIEPFKSNFGSPSSELTGCMYNNNYYVGTMRSDKRPPRLDTVCAARKRVSYHFDRSYQAHFLVLQKQHRPFVIRLVFNQHLALSYEVEKVCTVLEKPN